MAASRTGQPPGRSRSAIGWSALAVVLALPALAPLLVVALGSLQTAPEVEAHLSRYVLPRVVGNTVWLVLGVTTAAGVIGTVLAWLTSACEFPGRRVFSWALVLPLAFPGYVLGFVAIGLLDFAGPLQSALREAGIGTAWFPEIRSRGGVIAVMSLALYPYVYLVARAAFISQGRTALDAARVAGLSPASAFRRAALPMAWPWIAAGMALVGMETLADFGTVATFNYDTFTTAIYKAWFSLFSVEAAMRLAAILLVAVIILLALEAGTRGRRRYTAEGPPPTRLTLSPAARIGASILCASVCALGVLIPAIQLGLWTVASIGEEPLDRYLDFLWHSLLLAASAAALAAPVAIFLAYARRQAPGRVSAVAARIATLGYALPGPLLAVGVFVPLAWFSRALGDWTAAWDEPLRIALQSSVLALLLGYMVRFLAVAFGPVERGLLRVPASLDEAARTMGVRGIGLLRRVHVPLLADGIVTAVLLVFVEVMKEMPITLMVRPFGWETLAVRVFELTSEGEWQRAAMPALTIVLAGVVPVIALVRRTERH